MQKVTVFIYRLTDPIYQLTDKQHKSFHGEC